MEEKSGLLYYTLWSLWPKGGGVFGPPAPLPWLRACLTHDIIFSSVFTRLLGILFLVLFSILTGKKTHAEEDVCCEHGAGDSGEASSHNGMKLRAGHVLDEGANEEGGFTLGDNGKYIITIKVIITQNISNVNII